MNALRGSLVIFLDRPIHTLCVSNKDILVSNISLYASVSLVFKYIR